MMRFVFFFSFLLFASAADASLSSSQFAQALGTSVPNQLPKTFNILQTTNLADFRSVHILSNGVELLRPVAETVSTRPQLLPAATRVAGSRVLLRKGVGLLGPVGVAVTVGMLGKDVYDLACGSGGSSEYPSINTLCSLSTAIPAVSPLETKPAIGSVIVVNGNNYQLTSEVSSGTGGGSVIGWITNVGGAGPNTFGVKYGVTSTTVNGNPYYNYSFTYYKYSVPSTVPQVASTPDQFVSSLAPNDVVDAPYTTDFDKATKSLSDSGQTAMQPDADQIKALANTVQQDAAVDSAQTAVDSAQDNYDANPTAEALQALNEAKAALEAQKAASARDDVVAPPVPDSGDYDSGIELPEKKSILSLLQSFSSGSPIVSMLNSFTMSASGSGLVHLGDAYGKSIDIDFGRYEGVLGGCGGVLLVLVHGFAVLTVVRGW